MGNLAREEQVFLNEFEGISKDLKLPVWWRVGDTLRFGYAKYLKPEDTKQAIKNYLRYVEKAKNEIKLSQETLGFIGSGNLYFSGKDKSECTNVYLAFDPKVSSAEMEEYMILVKFCFLIVRMNSCIPKYQERFNIIISLLNCKSSKIFITSLFKHITFLLKNYFPFCVNNIFVVGSVSDINSEFAQFKSEVRDLCSSVIRVSEASMQRELLNYVDADQLEKKFGGLKEDIEEYWPPRPHGNPQDDLDYEMLGEKSCIPFFIFDDDYFEFRKENLKLYLQIDPRRNIMVPANAVVGRVGKEQTKINAETKSTETTEQTNLKEIKNRALQKQRSHSITKSKAGDHRIPDDISDVLTTQSQFDNMIILRNKTQKEQMKMTNPDAGKGFGKKNKQQVVDAKNDTSIFSFLGGCCGLGVTDEKEEKDNKQSKQRK